MCVRTLPTQVKEKAPRPPSRCHPRTCPTAPTASKTLHVGHAHCTSLGSRSSSSSEKPKQSPMVTGQSLRAHRAVRERHPLPPSGLLPCRCRPAVTSAEDLQVAPNHLLQFIHSTRKCKIWVQQPFLPLPAHPPPRQAAPVGTAGAGSGPKGLGGPPRKTASHSRLESSRRQASSLPYQVPQPQTQAGRLQRSISKKVYCFHSDL